MFYLISAWPKTTHLTSFRHAFRPESIFFLSNLGMDSRQKHSGMTFPDRHYRTDTN